ncbi:hypothetical protein JQ609_04315 [Bradyrhizobium sp. AUGA SZCCT0169]|uniref:hypothetical protein n=1 Tax=Bradyrhizobium sp. AUGA SZCCT0169 TaxID=2807663 RepID=UPI001BA7F5A8|nr:hypothetical protein [Bradyrhizobium sp. AUGA SZCCT0169]MBR1246153.1 hypothetical protein [Bradyrhizobium sp. AUGA SZCCT0169]
MRRLPNDPEAPKLSSDIVNRRRPLTAGYPLRERPTRKRPSDDVAADDIEKAIIIALVDLVMEVPH